MPKKILTGDKLVNACMVLGVIASIISMLFYSNEEAIYFLIFFLMIMAIKAK